MFVHSPINIYDKTKRSVVFVYAPSAIRDEPFPTQDEHPLGTAFLIAIPLEELGISRVVYYFVTNKHVLMYTQGALRKVDGSEVEQRICKRTPRCRICIRVNNTDNSAGIFHHLSLRYAGPQQNVWKHPEEHVDLIAVEMPLVEDFLPEGFLQQMIISPNSLKIEVGQDAFGVGYLSGYAGIGKNYPVVRFGRIALISDEKWLKSDRNPEIYEEGFLVELSSVGGASGSPVILDVPQRPDVPLLIGVVKCLVASLHEEQQGLVAMEPPHNVVSLFDELKMNLTMRGFSVK